jgi:hypothetical protein
MKGGKQMIRVIIGFVAGYTVAKFADRSETGEKVKNIILKCKEVVKEEFKKEEASEAS